MEYYIGLDVSLKETFVCVLDNLGKIIEERSIATNVCGMEEFLGKNNYKENTLIAIESGQLSLHLCKELKKVGYNIICVDARHMAAALSARINKNDKNDAAGIAKMLRAGLYKEVQIKGDDNCELKVVLGSRRQLVQSRQQIIGTIRGLLKIYGIKFGAESKKLKDVVLDKISNLSQIVKDSIDTMLNSLEAIELALKELDTIVENHVKVDEDSKLLMSIPGVGKITAITYKSSLDEAGRFEDSATVGAYMGLTPKQYASGEVNRHGGISKMGPKECRNMLYEAAMSLLSRSKKYSKLKAWGLKLAKKKGMKKAIVAVARKLAVIMHRMLIDRTEFKYV